MRATPRHILMFALVLHGFIGTIVLLSRIQPDGSDFDRYWTIATTAGRPYVDYAVERAPGELLILKGLARRAGTRAGFGPGIVLVNGAADAAIIVALGWGWGAGAAAFFAIAVLPIFDLLCARIDLWSMAAASIAVAAWQRDRRDMAAVALAVGGAFKVWPLPFAVLLLAPEKNGVKSGGKHGRRLAPVLIFAALGAAGALGWWAFAGTSGFRQVLTFRGAQGWQIESVGGSILLLAHAGTVVNEMGAHRIGATYGPLSAVMLAVAAATYLWALWKGARTAHLGAGWLAAVGTLLLCSTLFSTQYMGWLVPGAAIAWAEGDRRPALVTLAAVVLTAIEWGSYTALQRGDTLPVLYVIARNAVVAMMVWSAAAVLARAEVGGLELPRHLSPGETVEP